MLKTDGRKRSSEEQLLVRKLAVNMIYQQGFTKLEAATAVGATRQNVGRWCSLYEKGGLDALNLGRRGRRPDEPAKLKGWQCAKVVNLIKDNTPDQLKLPFVLWTAAAVRDLVKQLFEILLPLRSMRKYLKRWGFTPQKPVRKAWQQCPAKVKQWLEETYPQIASRAKARGAVIYWVDETAVTNQANVQRGYAPRGKTPVLRQNGTRFKLNMISGITNRGEVRFMCYTSTMTQSKFIMFLSKLIKSNKGPLVVISDNLKVHHGKKVKEWVSQRKEQIELEYMPSYSPELNPDEYLNRDLKKNVNASRTPATQDELKQNVSSFMHSIQKQPPRTMQYFNSKHIGYAA